jgi:hypothetical protein
MTRPRAFGGFSCSLPNQVKHNQLIEIHDPSFAEKTIPIPGREPNWAMGLV